MKHENRRLAAVVAAEIAGRSRLIGRDGEGARKAVRRLLPAVAALVFLSASVASGAGTLQPDVPDTVWLEEMTWPEFRQALRRGTDTVLVPVGGTEQGGRHLVLGKHNHTVRRAAELAARRLGNVLVAPVLPYAPEGTYAPAVGNMAFSGTIGLRESTLAAVAQDIANSLKVHGVRHIVFIADHGQSQRPLANLAGKLDEKWRPEGTAVLHIADYHGKNGQFEWLLSNGYDKADIGSHAGIADTSELMYVNPGGVRMDRLSGAAQEGTGASGDAAKASPLTGKVMVALKVRQIVKAVRQLRSAH